METVLPNLKMCDKVVSKKTGLPGVGEVVGIALAGWYYAVQIGVAESKQIDTDRVCKTWFDIYPNWLYYPLVTVFYKEPRKTLTWEEYCNCVKEPTQFEYDSIPMSQSVMYPIEDLELFDE